MTVDFSLDEFSWRELITTWLAVTKDLPVPSGLALEQALQRAEEILPRIRRGEVTPGDVEFDEELKDVLYALIRLVGESDYETPNERAADARAVHAFIREVWSEPDEFGERKMLLEDCASILKDPSSKRPVPCPLENDGYESLPWTPTVAASDPSTESARVAFVRSLTLIHETLIAGFGISEAAAVALEQQTYEWFLRFRSREPDTKNDRLLLMTLCCGLGEEHSPRKGDSARADDSSSVVPGRLVRFRQRSGGQEKS